MPSVTEQDGRSLRITNRVDADARQAAPPGVLEIIQHLFLTHHRQDVHWVLDGARPKVTSEERLGFGTGVEGGDRLEGCVKTMERERVQVGVRVLKWIRQGNVRHGE